MHFGVPLTQHTYHTRLTHLSPQSSGASARSGHAVGADCTAPNGAHLQGHARLEPACGVRPRPVAVGSGPGVHPLLGPDRTGGPGGVGEAPVWTG